MTVEATTPPTRWQNVIILEPTPLRCQEQGINSGIGVQWPASKHLLLNQYYNQRFKSTGIKLPTLVEAFFWVFHWSSDIVTPIRLRRRKLG